MKIALQFLFILIFVVLFFVTGFYYSIWHIHGYSKNFLKADRCLGSGGVFVYEESKCYMPGECEDIGGKWNGEERKCEK